jgi:hypothetical protein
MTRRSTAFCGLLISLTVVATGRAEPPPSRLVMVDEHVGPVIGPGVAGTEDNKSGFETGQVLKVDGVYHMFVNEMFGRSHLDMRIAHWTSRDATKWERRDTIVDSIPGRSPRNLRSEVWCTGVVFDEADDRWNVFYVAYRGGDEARGEKPNYDYDGKIWRAVSMAAGRGGIGGPYRDVDIILRPDEHSEKWEGQQGVDSFFPYKVGDRWWGLNGSHNHEPRGPWLVGMSSAPALAGPWKREPKLSPSTIADHFIENPIVTPLPTGRWIAIFDTMFEDGKPPPPAPFNNSNAVAYSISADGIRWPKGENVVIQSDANNWAVDVRTPLGLIPEDDGTFTVIYTARMKPDAKSPERKFWAMGKVRVRLAP